MKITHLKVFTLVISGMLGISKLSNAAPLTLVQDGQGKAVIRVTDEPHAKQAAEALQRYIQKISGARLAIRPEAAATRAEISIFIGHTAEAKKRRIKIPSGFDPSVRPNVFEEEGYILRTKGNDIFIGGNSDGPYAGTLYGAFAFLEKLGCRFYFPGDWGEIIPEMETINVPDLKIESHPDFPIRYIGLNPGWVPTTPEETKTYGDWRLKVGMMYKHGTFYPLVGDGFLGILLPPKDYWESHPEYYAMDKKGKRHVPTAGDINHTTMLCLSNLDVYTQVLKNLKKAFAEKHYLGLSHHPNTHRISINGIGISPPDGSPYCYCENCQKASQKFEYNNYVYGNQMSEEYFAFANKLAKGFPDKFVSTMAYSLRELPPQGVKLEPNITVYHAPISCCALHNIKDKHCWRNQEYYKILAEYRRQTPHVYLYEYNPHFLTGLFVPEPSSRDAAANIPIYKQLDIKGVSGEGRKAWMQTWTSYYLIAKLLWDADADVDALKKEFYTDFFGAKAGHHIQAWWDACETRMAAAKNHAHEDWLVNKSYNVEFTESIHRHIDAALKAKATKKQRERIEAVAIIADHLEAYAAMEEAEKNLDFTEAVKQGQRMMADKHKLNGIYSFFISETFPTVNPVPHFVNRGRIEYNQKIGAKVDGTEGVMVAPLPLEMAFARDPYHEGVIGRWFADDFDDKKWGTMNTFYTWDSQEEPEDEAGHFYDGYGWYRGSFKVPAKFKGRKITFFCGGGLNESWIYVNGEYLHHRKHQVWWWGNHQFDVDITDVVKPGKKNTIAICVFNKAEIGGLFRRGFFWSPKE